MADLGDTEASPLDPAASLSSNDPLRAWADQNLDWRTGRLLTQDPSAAIDSMIKRGIPPPDVHADGTKALPYTDPLGGTNDAAEPAPPVAPPKRPGSFLGFGGMDPVRTNPDGTIASNVTTPDVVPKPIVAPAPIASPLDPEEDVPLPKARPADAPGSTDVSGKKKPAAADALTDFSKSLAGIKAPDAPKLPAVGTPSVRSPSAINAPNLANLIALTQGTSPQTVLASLGKLLVAGKA